MGGPRRGALFGGVVELGEAPVDEAQLPLLVVNHHLRRTTPVTRAAPLMLLRASWRGAKAQQQGKGAAAGLGASGHGWLYRNHASSALVVSGSGDSGFCFQFS